MLLFALVFVRACCGYDSFVFVLLWLAVVSCSCLFVTLLTVLLLLFGFGLYVHLLTRTPVCVSSFFLLV